MFPLASVAVQVTVVVPNGKAVGALLVTDKIEQLSVTTGFPKTKPVGQLTDVKQEAQPTLNRRRSRG